MEKFYLRFIKKIIFPLLLFLFPLIKIAQGIDLTDTGYSLGNYRFFTSTEGVWVLTTYLSNVTGYLFTRLPFGGTMLGMKFYSSLFVSATALLGYRFFITKMPAWMAFLGEIMAIGLCWCPTVILYNYMTYFLFLLGALMLFRGLAGERPLCLIIAGVLLGLNVFVRIPNVLEAGLIVCVWYYGVIRHKPGKKVLRETLLCLAGYAGAFLVMIPVIMIHYGAHAPLDMIAGAFSMAGSAADYTPVQMLFSVADAYLHGMPWLFYMILCILPGIPFLMIRKEKFPRARKVIYCICIVFLFFVLGRWGMYNLKYYQKESALQWAVIFLMISLANMIWMLFTKTVDVHWKLIASIGIIIILITPLGSNNHVWPIINNMFFAAPVTLWMVFRFARWGKHYLAAGDTLVPLFPVKAMQSAIIMAVLIQSIGVGSCYVFRDGEHGEIRDTRVTRNAVAKGMYTTAANAESLEEISVFLDEQSGLKEKELILYGDIPALSYYLDQKPAIFTSWPELDTNSIGRLQTDLLRLSEEITLGGRDRALVIYNAQMDDEQENSDKKRMIDAFMKEMQYSEIYRNAQYVVFM